jgi:hypothetical protein
LEALTEGMAVALSPSVVLRMDSQGSEVGEKPIFRLFSRFAISE